MRPLAEGKGGDLESFLPRAGDKGDTLFYLIKGSVTVLIEDDEVVVLGCHGASPWSRNSMTSAIAAA